MKKILSTVLVAAMLAGTFALGAVGVSAKELELQPDDKAQYGNAFRGADGCGFIDGNLYFTTSLSVDKLEDIKVEVNGKPAYWNIGYKGYQHCQLRAANDVEKSSLQIGIVGAELTKDDKNSLTITAGGDTYTQTFSSAVAARGVAYSQVVADKLAKTVDVTIIYNENPGYKIGDELTGKCHDDHPTDNPNKGTFKVTGVDGNKVTLKATDYVPKESLLELVDGNGVYTTVTINTANIAFSDKTVKGTQINLVKATAVSTNDNKNLATASNLINGSSVGKLEGDWVDGGFTITVEAEKAAKATLLALYTDDDGANNNRAPKTFKVYGSNEAGQQGTEIGNIEDSKIENRDDAVFTFPLTADAEYKYYTIVISAKLGEQNGYFQIRNLELYSGETSVEDTPRGETVTGPTDSNGSVPTTPPQDDEQTPTTPGGDQNNGGEQNPPATGDIALILSVIALIAVAGAVVIAKRRKIEN